MFYANAVDTIGSLDNAGTVVVNANMTVANGATNSGNMTLAADLTVSDALQNDGKLAISGTRTITSGGLTGTGLIDLTTGNVNVSQTADSTYSGSVGRDNGDGNATSAAPR